MALDREDYIEIAKLFSDAVDRLNSSKGSSRSSSGDFDIKWRKASDVLKDLADDMIKYKDDAAKFNDAQRQFSKTLKSKIDDISRSSGTFTEKIEELETELKKLDNVTEEYKDKVKKAAEYQIKHTEATKIQTEATEKFTKTVDSVNKAFAPLGGLISGIAKGYQSGGNAIGTAGNLLSTSVGFAASTAQQAGSGLQSLGIMGMVAGGKLGFLGKIAGGVGLGLQFFGSGLNAVATKVLPFLTTEAEKALTGFQSISSTGAIFADGVIEMASAGAAANLNLQQFSEVVKSNSETFAESRLGVAGATKKMGEAFTAGGKNFRDGLLRLGYSTEEQAALVADSMAIMGRAGKDLKSMSGGEIAKATQDYATNLRVIANATGVDAKRIQDQAREQMSTLQMQAEIEKRKRAGDVNAESRFNATFQVATQAGKEVTNATRQMLGQGFLIGETAQIFSQLGPAGEEFQQSILKIRNDKTLDPAKAADLTNDAIARLNQGIRDNPKLMERFGTVIEAGIGGVTGAVAQGQAGVLAGSNKFTEGMTAEQRKIALEAQKPGEKGSDKAVTDKLLGAADAAEKFKLEMQKAILTDNVLGKFAKSITDVTKTITDLIKKYGDGAGSITGTLVESVGSIADTLLKYGEEILGLMGAIGIAKSVYNRFNGSNPPKPPGPNNLTGGPTPPRGPTPSSPSGLTQNAKGQWQRPNGQFATKAEIAEHLNPKTPTPEPPAKTGIKGRLSNMASKGASVIESVLGNKAGVAGIFSAISGDIGGVIESAKELVSGVTAKMAGAGTTAKTAAEATGVKAATDAAEKIGAKSAAEAGSKLATTVGAKALTAMKGVGAILASETLGYAGGKLKESGHEKLGAAADIASETAQMASLGAMLGSVVPGVGTAIGGGLGAVAGGAYGLYKNYNNLFGGKPETTAPAKVEDKAKPAEKPPEKVETIQKNIEQITIQTALIKSAIIDSITLKEKKAETGTVAKPTENKTTVQPVPAVPTPGAALPKELDNTNPSNPKYVKPDDSSIPKTALEIKNDLVKEIAGKMGIKNTDNLTSTMQGGVPTSINGTPVPTNLYSEEQLKSISLATQARNLIQGKVDTKTLSPMVAPNNPALTNNTTSMAQQYATEIEESKKALNAKTQDQTIKTTNEPTTNQVLASLSKEIGKMAVALEEMVDYTRATASNTRNTYHAVS